MGKYYSEEKLKQNINDINFFISKSGYGRYVEELENRIDRAIAYLEAGKTFPGDETRETVEYMQIILLDILKGSDKE